VGRFGADRGATRSPAHRSRAARRLCPEARRRTAPGGVLEQSQKGNQPAGRRSFPMTKQHAPFGSSAPRTAQRRRAQRARATRAVWTVS
jgi:hypothetical protein